MVREIYGKEAAGSKKNTNTDIGIILNERLIY